MNYKNIFKNIPVYLGIVLLLIVDTVAQALQLISEVILHVTGLAKTWLKTKERPIKKEK
jgi:hypothetical protein